MKINQLKSLHWLHFPLEKIHSNIFAIAAQSFICSLPQDLHFHVLLGQFLSDVLNFKAKSCLIKFVYAAFLLLTTIIQLELLIHYDLLFLNNFFFQGRNPQLNFSLIFS
jgi:hypothetical protein